MTDKKTAAKKATTPAVEQPAVVPSWSDDVYAAVAASRAKRPPGAPITSKRASTRVPCSGCGYGIRKETTPTYIDLMPMHPNCAKAIEDPAFRAKLHPRNLASEVMDRAIGGYLIVDITPDEQPAAVAPAPEVKALTKGQQEVADKVAAREAARKAVAS